MGPLKWDTIQLEWETVGKGWKTAGNGWKRLEAAGSGWRGILSGHCLRHWGASGLLPSFESWRPKDFALALRCQAGPWAMGPREAAAYMTWGHGHLELGRCANWRLQVMLTFGNGMDPWLCRLSRVRIWKETAGLLCRNSFAPTEHRMDQLGYLEPNLCPQSMVSTSYRCSPIQFSPSQLAFSCFMLDSGAIPGHRCSLRPEDAGTRLFTILDRAPWWGSRGPAEVGVQEMVPKTS